MDTKACVFYMFVAIMVIDQVSCQVGQLCRPNERFLSCGGCQKTCREPSPVCVAICREGCYCNQDEVRNDTGHCIKLADCPPTPLIYRDEVKESQPTVECPPNEEYRLCEPCNKTCDNPNPICPAQCGRGCYCKEDLVRDVNGTCVKYEQCSKTLHKSENTNYITLDSIPFPYQLKCGPREVYKECHTCEGTCSNPNPHCTSQCIRGCFCENNLVRSPSGQCVELEHCPKAEVSMGSHDPSVEDCGSDEEYLSCGWCEASCSEPAPSCPRGVCTRGCLCRPGLLRHHSGHCVEEKHCLPQKCPDPNEEFVCRYGCEARCDRRPCSVRARRCTLGCHCALGVLRDGATGKCVMPEKCTSFNNTTAIREHKPLYTIKTPLSVFNATEID